MIPPALKVRSFTNREEALIIVALSVTGSLPHGMPTTDGEAMLDLRDRLMHDAMEEAGAR